MPEREPTRVTTLAWLAPLAVAAFVFAVHATAGPSAALPPAPAGQPALVIPALLARLVPIGDVAAREQLAAAALVAMAAALVVHALAARGDRASALGGVVAGLWLAASPPGWALARGLGPEVVALAACAAVVVGHDRLARGGGPAAAGLVGGASALALLADPRAAMLITVAAALAVYRGRRGARWIALVPAYGAGAAALLVGAAAIAGGPVWPAPAIERGLDPWLATLVDDLGPVALVAGAAGGWLALSARGERWLAAALVAGALAAIPPSRPVPPVALIALAVGVGVAVTAAARAAEAVGARTAGGAGAAPGKGPWAVALALAAVILVPPVWRSAGAARERDRARVSAYAAAPWTSSPATGR